MKRKDDLQTIRSKNPAELAKEIKLDKKDLIKGSDDSNMHSARIIKKTIARKLTVIKEMKLVHNENE